MAKNVKDVAPVLAGYLGEDEVLKHTEKAKNPPVKAAPIMPPIQPKRVRQLVALLIERPAVTDDEIIGYWKDANGNKVADTKSGGVHFVNGLVDNMNPAFIATVRSELDALKKESALVVTPAAGPAEEPKLP